MFALSHVTLPPVDNEPVQAYPAGSREHKRLMEVRVG